MHVTRLWLTDFRNYESADLTPAPEGLTVIQGANGEGKTNLLEAIGYLATLGSFRGAPGEALIRTGCDHAVVRAEAERDGRRLLLEAELHLSGRDRVQVNRQPLRRARDLLGSMRVSVFAPDDLALIKAGPSVRRQYLDAALVALHPKHDALQGDVDRILRQRGALLKQAGGRLTPEVEATLEVWDAKLSEKGSELASARDHLALRLAPMVQHSYVALAAVPAELAVRYERSWRGSLADTLAASRADDLRRAVTLVGPHRDDLVIDLDAMPARTHASQGEQRSAALALRLGAHQLVSEEVGDPPVLLLDDVFSELDPARSEALVASLPACQSLLTTAGALPASARPNQTVHVRGGRVVGVAA